MYNKLKGEFMKYLKYLFLLIYISIALFICTRASVSGEASTEESDEVTDIVVGTIDAITPGEESITEIYGIDKVKQFVRKGIGHFGLFAFLGVFGFITFHLFFKNKKIGILFNLLSGFVIAGISEIIQIFANERGPAFSDVLLDFSGYLLSAILSCFVILIIYIIRKKKVVNE